MEGSLPEPSVSGSKGGRGAERSPGRRRRRGRQRASERRRVAGLVEMDGRSVDRCLCLSAWDGGEETGLTGSGARSWRVGRGSDGGRGAREWLGPWWDPTRVVFWSS